MIKTGIHGKASHCVGKSALVYLLLSNAGIAIIDILCQ